MTECFLHLSPLLSGHELEQTPGDSEGQDPWCGPDSVFVEILSLFCVECGKDRGGVIEGELPEGTESSVYTVLLCLRF